MRGSHKMSDSNTAMIRLELIERPSSKIYNEEELEILATVGVLYYVQTMVMPGRLEESLKLKKTF